MIPLPGGTIENYSKAFAPHFKNANLSLFLSNSIFSFSSKASLVLATSTIIEWSTTSSTGHKGLIFFGSLPSFLNASLIAAKSTTAGTPVKSYNKTLDGLKGISTYYF